MDQWMLCQCSYRSRTACVAEHGCAGSPCNIMAAGHCARLLPLARHGLACCRSRGTGSLAALRSGWACLPEVVVDSFGAVEAPERHLDTVADLDRVGVDIGHLGLEPSAAVVVDDYCNHRR